MTVRDLREKYLQFFKSKGHDIYPSGSLIPVDVTGRLDESLLFNGAGMVQFKPYFRGVAEPPNKRLTTAQKCVRTGDIEDVGNLSHLTFFEMLGNFSFGDYFKKEAIAFSWEFLTSKEWLGLDPQRLSFTVFEDDDEAYECWLGHFQTVGIDGKYRVFRLGEETNYWPAGAFSNGPPGPCGPNSEMFYWTADTQPPGIGYTREEWLKDDAAKNWLEIWNDVFIQFEWQGKLKNPERPAEGYEKTGMPPLPFNSVDTGMGLERTAAVLGGFASVYDTDAFQPIIRKIESISGSYRYGSDDAKDTATRIIADHIRTACFCIADGVLPGNSGRGYVLRRLIRRAVLKGQRILGFEQPFFHLVFEGVLESMGNHYQELTDRRETIVETLRQEEALFRRTLTEGFARLNLMLTSMTAQSGRLDEAIAFVKRTNPGLDNASDVLEQHGLFLLSEVDGLTSTQKPGLESIDAWWFHFQELVIAVESNNASNIEISEKKTREAAKTLAGDFAFRLYDTYGFPLEVTKELCAEAGVTVDGEGYEAALKEAQERSRGGSDRESVYGGVQVTIVAQIIGEDAKPTPTEFLGYQSTHAQTQIAGAIHIPGERDSKESGHWPLAIALKETPFYAESGGQVSDTGMLIGGGFEGRVTDVIKQDGVFVHEVEPIRMPFEDPAKLTGVMVEAEVDENRRARITRNHTATHLLHAALRQVLGKHVTQAGSYVGPDRLRFDFTHGQALTDDQKSEVERIVNEKALENLPVTIYRDLPIKEAKAMGAMALFGEKYGEFVRLVQVGDEQPEEKSFSRELCGGIHVRTTAEIGLFKIVHEASAASGVRRIEALSGEGAYEWVLEQANLLHSAAERLKTSPKDLLPSIDKHLEAQRELKQRLDKARSQSSSQAETKLVDVMGVELAVQVMGEGEQQEASLAADQLIDGHPGRVALTAVAVEGKAIFICKVGSEALKRGAHAGNLVREVAKMAGGGGGGRPDFATAGGKDVGKIGAAVAAAEGVLKSMLEG
ncbi:MAG TPA: alanine--tRNA ligase [Fimbriimonadaceae bacterium]|nr:alanine--tRNA ligase [Fimbriimonadaceae bacterium]